MRPYLAMLAANINFDQEFIPLDEPGTKAAILKVSPNGKVPCMKHRDVLVWDSLAICEYIAEVNSMYYLPSPSHHYIPL